MATVGTEEDAWLNCLESFKEALFYTIYMLDAVTAQ